MIMVIGVDGEGSKKCQEQSFQSVRPSSCWGGRSGDVRRDITGVRNGYGLSLHRARNYQVLSSE